MAGYSQVPPRSPVMEGGPQASYNHHQQFQESGPQMTHAYPPGTSYVPYTDEPLQPQMAGFHGGNLNHTSIASNSGWNSHASLQDEHGLLPGAVAPGGSSLPYGGAQDGYGSSTALYKNEPDRGYNPVVYSTGAAAASTKSRRPKWLVPVIIVAVVIAIAGGVVAYFLTRKKDDASSASSNSGSSQNNGGSNGSNPTKPSVLLGGADGSQITLDDGTKFTYTNSYGGSWYYNPDHPLDGPAGQANSWTPPVNESWRWGTDKQFGVNLGGWLVLEPFISPAMYDRFYPDAVDEWTLSNLLAADTANGGLHQLEEHYKTFITEADFANIAAAGLNWIRLPVPFWAISKLPSEPFLEKVAWQYFLKAIVWARKYGLRINLDLHTLPGSQNGWNHSGRLGQPFNWMQGVMGIANAQRSMDYIRIYAEFISKPEITNIVPMFGVLNEPRGNILGQQPLKDVYYHIYTTLRGMTGIGKGPVLSFHTGFFDDGFAGWLPKADRIMLDRHPYLIFDEAQTNAPPATFARTPCVSWKQWTDTVSNTFGMNSAGEWSCALSDCALYINNVGVGADFEDQFGAGTCKPLLDYKNWSADFKAGMLTYTSAMMDAFGSNFFFWTWRIGPSTRFNNTIQAPDWSYELGLQEGWIPKDPRTAQGTCTKLGYDSHTSFDGVYDTWQVTGEGATLNPATTEAYPWPPASLTRLPNGGALPTYTATGAIPTLIVTDAPAAMQTFTPDLGGVGMMVPIANCQYPDAYNAGMTIPDAC